MTTGSGVSLGYFVAQSSSVASTATPPVALCWPVRPLGVLRDGAIVGVVSFAVTGDVVGRQVVAAIAAHNPRARIVYVSRDGDVEARSLARSLGLEFSAEDSVPSVQGAGDHGGGLEMAWIGDGSDPRARESIAASRVSASVAPLSRVRDDAADVLLPYRGLTGLGDLLGVGRMHANRLAGDYRAVYWANLLGASGALFASFSTLQVGLLSNVGTGLVYARHAWALQRLAAAGECRVRSAAKALVR